MKPFALLSDRPARWTSPLRWRRRFELAAGEDVFASLDYEKASGALVMARTSAEAWTLATEGLCGVRVVVRDAIRGKEIAMFRGDWRGGGHVERVSGPSLMWSAAGPAMTRWLFRAGSLPLADFRLDAMRLVPTAMVRLERGVAESPDAPLLATLGGYLALQAFEQGAGLAAVTSFA
jgi:hypothetical protein